MKQLITWLKNARTAHHRVMMRFLQKRGWVVFYLEERNRVCGDGTCWLRLYKESKTC